MATANATNGTKQPPNGTAQPPDGTKSSPDPKVAEEHFLGVLRKFIKEEKEDLDRFYPTDNAKLRAAATKAAPMYTELIRRKCPSEMAVRFASLTLYDLVVLLDDSDTMVLQENGERRENLKKVLKEVTDIYSLARTDGIVSVRFFNTRKGRKNVRPEKGDILSDICYTGLTMIGTQLQKKILDPFVYTKKERPSENASKPVLVMVITDGDVEGESQGYLKKVINNCIAYLQTDVKGQHGAAFYFSRIGDDEGAKALIEGLDNDELLGPWIDCFPVKRRLEEINEPEKKWHVLQKLLLGALFKDLDKNDEGKMFEDTLIEEKVKENEKITEREDEYYDSE